MSAPEKEYIPSWLDDYPLTPLEFRLYCRISRRGECMQSPGKLAKEWGLSDRTIRDAFGLLLAAGLIGRKPNGPQRFIHFALGHESWARPDDVATIRATVLGYRGKGKAEGETTVTTTEVDATEVKATVVDEQNHGNGNHGCYNRGSDNRPTSVITTDIRESHKGNPNREREREQAPDSPLIGLVPDKAAQPDGREKEKAPPDSAHHRLMAKRVEVFGKTTAMAREAKAAKWLLDNFTEAEIYEYMAELAQAADERGFTPSLDLVSRQIDVWKRRKASPVKPPAKPGYVSQADINAPGRGLVM